MSLMRPQSSPPSQKTSIHTRLLIEWKHFAQMPTTQLLQFALPSLLLFLLDPLVPIAAYLLHIWAGSVGTWRDRWASLLTTAKQSCILLAALGIYLLLNQTQIGPLPAITTTMQLLWHAYLPGTLSLSPLDGRDLLARSLLFLPIAPLLTVYNEHIDPRTISKLNRVLTPNDLKPPPKPSQKTPPASSTPIPPSKPSPASARPAKHTGVPKAKKTPNASSKHQMTIDSFLTPNPQTDTPSGSSAQPLQTQEPQPINWDDITE